MKHIHFDVKPDGFYGAYWKCKKNSNTPWRVAANMVIAIITIGTIV